MEAINKNKEEIKKILKEVERLKDKVYKKLGSKEVPIEYKDEENWEEFWKSDLAYLKTKLQERIKTSILWCEDEIEFINDIINLWDLDSGYNTTWEKLQQLQIHLTWLKEQEKKYG